MLEDDVRHRPPPPAPEFELAPEIAVKIGEEKHVCHSATVKAGVGPRCHTVFLPEQFGHQRRQLLRLRLSHRRPGLQGKASSEVFWLITRAPFVKAGPRPPAPRRRPRHENPILK